MPIEVMCTTKAVGIQSFGGTARSIFKHSEMMPRRVVSVILSHNHAMVTIRCRFNRLTFCRLIYIGLPFLPVGNANKFYEV